MAFLVEDARKVHPVVLDLIGLFSGNSLYRCRISLQDEIDFSTLRVSVGQNRSFGGIPLPSRNVGDFLVYFDSSPEGTDSVVRSIGGYVHWRDSDFSAKYSQQVYGSFGKNSVPINGVASHKPTLF
ncbi:MAG: hypothetical protein ACP5NS_00170 [Candidatus Pacearchaeota archaeon]